MALDLERIGDLAKNCAKRLLTIGDQHGALPRSGLEQLHRQVVEQLHLIGNLIVVHDAESIDGVLKHDSNVDELFNSVFREIMDLMVHDPDFVPVGVHAMFVAKNLERIGDHVTNIAESLHYVSSGNFDAGLRAKSDITPLIIS